MRGINYFDSDRKEHWLKEIGKQVNDKDSFSDFLRSLAGDFTENHDEWQNWTIADYLESISAWIKDSGEEELEHMDFKEMAKVFYAGKIYE